MHPGGRGDKLLQEQGRRDRAAGARAGIFHVGNNGLEPVEVFLFHGQAPKLFASGGGRRGDRRRQVFVFGKQARDVIPQGHDTGPGEGGQVNDGIHAQLFGKHQGIGQGKATLGIGVVDLDGFAIGGGENVAGA